MAKANACTIENSLISQQILNSTSWSRFRRRLFFILASSWLLEERFRLVNEIIKVLGLPLVVTIETTDSQETRQVMAFTN